MSEKIEVRRVVSKKDWEDFIELPWKIYKGYPNWVPPIRLQVRETLCVEKNPFFKHAYMCPLIAIQNDQVVGRLVAVIDDAGNRFHNERVANFGFFECINDKNVATQLFYAAQKWSKERGMTHIRGPLSPSTNHECGLLIDGFEHSPMVMMAYNPEYYSSLIEDQGFKKAKDLFAYYLETNNPFSDRLMAHAQRLREKGSIKLRPINMRKFDEEVETILKIYNDAWEKNWGFVPMTDDEFRHMAKEMKPILDPKFLLIAEVRGEIAGFGLALPDVYQAQKKLTDGKLFPFGLIKLLWNLKGPFKRSVIKDVRILTLGIKKEYRDLGIGPILYLEYLKMATSIKLKGGEASWILEDNIPMNKALENMNAKKSKVYRIYEKQIA